jgi:aspartate carbamoyltransferase regulatory subunit
LARRKNNEVVIVSPEEVRSTQEEIDDYRQKGLNVTVLDSLEEAIEYAQSKPKPFIYGLRTQEGRLDNKTFEKVKDAIYLTLDLLNDYDSGVLPILHPLPMNKKNPEIAPEIDFLPGAEYFMQMRMGEFVRMALMALSLGAVKTSADDRPYVDTRGSNDKEKYMPVELEELVDDSEVIMQTMDSLTKKDKDCTTFKECVPKMMEYLDDPESLQNVFLELFSRITDNGRLIELVRHLTFRFKPGEDGFVVDKIDNGKTGIVKYMLDLSSHIGHIGSDGNPILLSAVDGLEGKKSGMKGVIKMRGYMPSPEEFQIAYLLSRRLPVITEIRDGKPFQKFVPTRPEVLYDTVICKNPDCVTQDSKYQHAKTAFYHNGDGVYQCRHCDTKVHMDRLTLKKAPEFEIPRAA